MKERIKHIKTEVYKFGFDTLVVIFGVLIALGLNDWNENRKLRDLENEMLNGIRENLIASRTNLELSISYNEQTVIYYERILDHIEKDLPYSIELDTAFSNISYWSDPYFTYSAYETLKFEGLDIIQNDSIKKTIAEIYEHFFPFVIGELKGEWELHQSLILPFVAKNIRYINGKTARPNNFNSLKTNDEFLNLMGLKMMTRNNSIQFAINTKQNVNSLIGMIDKELSK